MAKYRDKVRRLKENTLVIYFAARDPRMPVFVRVFAILVAAYALSPIDLIPDFIPVLGYLDDLLIVPVGLNSYCRCRDNKKNHITSNSG